MILSGKIFKVKRLKGYPMIIVTEFGLTSFKEIRQLLILIFKRNHGDIEYEVDDDFRLDWTIICIKSYELREAFYYAKIERIDER